MFQTFEVTTAPENGPPRIAALRAAMVEAGLDGFLVPRADAHQGEQVAPRDARLAWLTGFTGSAGLAVVLADQATLFVDGRYTLQAQDQVDPSVLAIQKVPDVKPSDWTAAALGDGATLGYDPWLHTAEEVERWTKALNAKGQTLKAADNLIDRIWPDQPPPPVAPISPYPAEHAGRTHGEKRGQVAGTLRDQNAKAAVLTLPDSICWLLNIRGADIERAPFVHAFAIAHDDETVALFVDPQKVTDAVRAHLGDAVRIEPPAALGAALAALEGPVVVDKSSAPAWVSTTLDAAGIAVAWHREPCILPKACKTAAELGGARAAHRRDGAAVTEFLAWLDRTNPATLTEIDVVRALEARRRATNALRDIAFETICGSGPNGAIVHYRVTEATNRRLLPGELLLVDSGGQYLDGTTDITRTVALGPVDPDAARAFTLVLKGMIAISRARWPEGLAGRDIDALARTALWQAGLDYDHGTGHGVGAYLGVHEGPAGISRRSVEPLKPGMILSNEPGYYREGAFGIRIENLLAVTSPTTPDHGDRPMLGFETLTLAPIDRRLIRPDLLDPAERDWLNAYHARVAAEIGSLVSPETRDWLDAVTHPI